jgi:hypothetical protein
MSEEGFTPTASTFPEVNTAGIAKSLKIIERGKMRGEENSPHPDQEMPDAVELEIIENLRFLKNQGTEFYENMLTAYRARVNRADSISQEIKTGSLTAKGDFLASATNKRAEMAHSLMGVVDALKYLSSFRQEHNLNRPYIQETNSAFYSLIIVVVLMLFVEVCVNAFFFAETSPQGFLGGAFFALIFALANVTISGFVGWFARYKNHKIFFLKGLAYVVIVIFLATTVSLNWGIGLYRDALEATGDVTLAGADWKSRINNENYMLQNIKSVVLALMGNMISLITVTKTYASFDPYPGYGAVAKRVENALLEYSDHLFSTIAELEEKRDIFIDDFRDSCNASDTFLSEAANALSGQATLTNKLNAFNEDISEKSYFLIQMYREANIQARTDGQIPKSFNKKLGIDKEIVKIKDTSKTELKVEKHRSEIKEISNAAVDEIAKIYEKYVSYFPSIESLRNDWREVH